MNGSRQCPQYSLLLELCVLRISGVLGAVARTGNGGGDLERGDGHDIKCERPL